LWQKWTTGRYLRRFDAYHCLILASCHDLEQEFDSFLQ
jgi:hypothetical protein